MSGPPSSNEPLDDSAAVIGKLKSLLQSRPLFRSPSSAGTAGAATSEEERCELCGTLIPPDHRHLVNLETRSLMCACRPCGLLFTNSGAAGGKFRAVPERYLRARGLVLTEAQWETLQIPVNIAFFFYNSTLGHTAAFYPSPAGATESLLPLETWEELARTNPILSGLEPDVEALLVYKRQAGSTVADAAKFECYVVPIDACYELVGRIRKRWKGFAGGEEAWSEIDAFFASVREKSGESPETPGTPAHHEDTAWPI
jgi:hypothetical protein